MHPAHTADTRADVIFIDNGAPEVLVGFPRGELPALIQTIHDTLATLSAGVCDPRLELGAACRLCRAVLVCENGLRRARRLHLRPARGRSWAAGFDATRCAVGIQDGMRERNVSVPRDKRLEFRIGINVGDVIIEDNDIFGHGVNVAARLEGIAEPGGIVISAIAHDAVSNRVEAEFRDLGGLSLKKSSVRGRSGSARLPGGKPRSPRCRRRGRIRPRPLSPLSRSRQRGEAQDRVKPGSSSSLTARNLVKRLCGCWNCA